MPKRLRINKSAPALKVHAGTGQAYVILDGRRVYLGKADSRATSGDILHFRARVLIII